MRLRPPLAGFVCPLIPPIGPSVPLFSVRLLITFSSPKKHHGNGRNSWLATEIYFNLLISSAHHTMFLHFLKEEKASLAGLSLLLLLSIAFHRPFTTSLSTISTSKLRLRYSSWNIRSWRGKIIPISIFQRNILVSLTRLWIETRLTLKIGMATWFKVWRLLFIPFYWIPPFSERFRILMKIREKVNNIA